VEEYGGVTFREGEARAGSSPRRQAYTVWSPFAADTDYFAPSEKPFMINFRVTDLDALLAQLRSEGVRVDERTEKSEFGYFGWAMDRREIDLSCGSHRKSSLQRTNKMGGEGFEPPTYWV
jgi:hypothetical protein